MNKVEFKNWCCAYNEGKKSITPLVMGVLNVTPDSFYDGGKYLSVEMAYDRAQAMIADGADLIDVGGESSKPGAEPISIDEELNRVMPIIEKIQKLSPIALSIDTSKPEVMQAAADAGVACINDVFALRAPGALAIAAGCDLPICLMHMQGAPKNMQQHPHYDKDVVEQVDEFFEQRILDCMNAGIDRHNLILDPGFGFGKTKQHNLQLVHHIRKFQRHKLPMMLGVSRKSTVGEILNQPPSQRMIGSLALGIYAMLQGVSIIRTHDVLETKQAFHIIQTTKLSDRS